MYNSIEDWINKPHQSVEEILEELSDDTFFNLMITEAIREDALDNALMKFQNRLDSFQKQDDIEQTTSNTPNFDLGDIDTSLDVPEQTDAGEENLDFSDTSSTSATGDNFDFGGDEPSGDDFDFGGDSGDLDLNLGGDDFNFGGDSDSTPGDDFSMGVEDTEDQKDKLTSNIRQVMELRDLLDDVSSSTSDPEILKINQQLNKLLSTIANMGGSIMDRDDIAEINAEMEDFIQTAVEQAKSKIEQIREKNRQEKQEM